MVKNKYGRDKLSNFINLLTSDLWQKRCPKVTTVITTLQSYTLASLVKIRQKLRKQSWFGHVLTLDLDLEKFKGQASDGCQ